MQSNSLADLHFSPSRCKGDGNSSRARPGSKGRVRKNHEAQIISWTGRALYLVWYRAGPVPSVVQGGQAVLSPRRGVFRSRGARPGARAARPILRKQRRISGRNSFPADAFSAPCPCFQAASSVWSRSKIQKVKMGKTQLHLDNPSPKYYEENICPS